MCSAYLNGETVDLYEMLNAREQRAKIQEKMLQQQLGQTLISATMNIPGPVKTNLQLLDAFLITVNAINQAFPPKENHTKLFRELKTGPEYYSVIDEQPTLVKKKMIEIEATHFLGRLMDLDVLHLNNGKKQAISRIELQEEPRKCFICSQPAKVCGRQRMHSIEEMQQMIFQLIQKGN